MKIKIYTHARLVDWQPEPLISSFSYDATGCDAGVLIDVQEIDVPDVSRTTLIHHAIEALRKKRAHRRYGMVEAIRQIQKLVEELGV